MSKNEKQGVSPDAVRRILNQVWRGHSSEIEAVIAALQKNHLVAPDDELLSAAAAAKIPVSELDRALSVAGLPLEKRILVKVNAAAAGLIA